MEHLFDQFQERLRERYGELRHERAAADWPVWILEHDLEEPELQLLKGMLQRAFHLAPLSSSWWRPRTLPLLVWATEVGYQYQGNGTDFWPILSHEMGHGFSGEDREYLSHFFKLAQQEFGIANPPDVPWTHQFHHIAWPITNAVLPQDTRLAFCEALRQLPARIDMATDNEWIQHVLQNARVPHWSNRYDAWLEMPGLSGELAKAFLDPEYLPAMLTRPMLERLRRDLMKDEPSRRQVDVARRHQANMPQRSKPEVTEPVSHQRRGQLSLRFTGQGEALLEAALPLLPIEIRRTLAPIIRTSRGRMYPWGLTQTLPIPSGAFLASESFPLKALPATPEEPFLPQAAALPLSPEVQAELGRLCFDLRRPLLFDDNGEESFPQRTATRTLSVSDRCYILLDVEPAQRLESAGAQPLGEVAGLQVFHVQVDQPQIRDVLKQIGLTIDEDDGVECRWIHDLPCADQEDQPTFLTEDINALWIRALPTAIDLDLHDRFNGSQTVQRLILQPQLT